MTWLSNPAAPRPARPAAGVTAGAPARRVAALVAAGTAAIALWHYLAFLDEARFLWNGAVHDRSGHYEFALNLALSLRTGDLHTFLATLEKSTVWPPVHGLLAGLALLLHGPDHRVAVLPSLGGWAMTVVCGFLLARRISPRAGTAAGLIAAAMILASPAYRAYATDIMLESLGAGLTMLALTLYATAKQQPAPTSWRWLALVLTLLFFEKYNYWLLVVLALAAAELSEAPRRHAERLAGLWRRVPWRAWLSRQIREPLNYVLAAALAFPVLLALRPGPIDIAGLEIRASPRTAVTLPFAVLVLRLAVGLRRLGPGAIDRLGQAARPLLLWHALPIIVSLMIPKRLGNFMWFLSPANEGEVPARDIAVSVAFYLDTIIRDYHAGPAGAILAGLSFLLALLAVRRLRPGGRAVLLLVLIAAVLTLLHPNQKSRFLHSWLALAWVAGGAGLAALLAGWPARARADLRRWLPAAAAVLVVVLQAPAMLRPGHAPEPGRRGERTSLLDITDAYLPAVAGAARVAVFATEPIAPLVGWTHRERTGRLDGVEWPLFHADLSAPQVRDAFAAWRRASTAEMAVFVDLPPGSVHAVGLSDHAAYAQIPALMATEPAFETVSDEWLPDGAARVMIWRRRPGAG